jgi:hypothetical protein
MKNLYLLIVVLFAAAPCAGQNVLPLKDNPDIKKVFSKEEISNLNLIVKFFDNTIIKSTNNADINKAYHEYFKKVADSESFEKIGNDLDSARSPSLKELIDMLKKSGIFYEIWNRKYGYFLLVKSKTKRIDTVDLTISLNLRSKYFRLLKLESEKDVLIKQYYGYAKIAGISPSCDVLFLKRYKDVDFSHPINRLIWAIHYITNLYKVPYTNNQ